MEIHSYHLDVSELGSPVSEKGKFCFLMGRDLTIFKNEMSEHSEFLVYNDMIRKSNAKIRILWKKRVGDR